MKKTALITGGTRGIGFGIAKALASESWDLVLNGVRSEADANEALESLRALGVQVTYARGDIGSPEGRQAVWQVTRSTFQGPPRLLVNNAGIAPKVRADILDTSEESYDAILDTNLKAPFFLTQTCAKAMIEARRNDPSFTAMIIVVGSVSATHSSINRAEYCIAKAGLGMLAQTFATRLGPEGIPVYELRPGVIRTDMTAAVTEKYDRLIAQGLCVQPRWGFPDDVGRAVASLARGDFPYSSGQVIHIDGGLSIPRL